MSHKLARFRTRVLRLERARLVGRARPNKTVTTRRCFSASSSYGKLICVRVFRCYKNGVEYTNNLSVHVIQNNVHVETRYWFSAHRNSSANCAFQTGLPQHGCASEGERYNTCAAPRLRTHDCWPRMCKLNSSLFSLFKIVPLEKSGLDQRRGGVLIACTKTMFYCLRIISQQ